MKECPKCSSVYTDESLSFCLADGTPLVAPDSEKTEILKDLGAEPETEEMLSVETRESVRRETAGQNVGSTTSVEAAPSRIGGFLLVGLLGIVVGSVLVIALMGINPLDWGNKNVNFQKQAGKSLTVEPTYRVIGVKSDDVLNIRPEAGNLKRIVAKIPPDGTGIVITGSEKKIKRTTWVPIRFREHEGWVNRSFLARDD